MSPKRACDVKLGTEVILILICYKSYCFDEHMSVKWLCDSWFLTVISQLFLMRDITNIQKMMNCRHNYMYGI